MVKRDCLFINPCWLLLITLLFMCLELVFRSVFSIPFPHLQVSLGFPDTVPARWDISPPGSPALTAFHVWVQLFPHPGRPPASFVWYPTCWDDLSRVFAFDEVLCFMQCFNASVSLMFYDYVKYNNCSPVRNPTDDPNEMLIMFSHQLNKEERQACSLWPLVICIGNHTNTSVIPSATPVFHKRSRGC